MVFNFLHCPSDFLNTAEISIGSFVWSIRNILSMDSVFIYMLEYVLTPKVNYVYMFPIRKPIMFTFLRTLVKWSTLVLNTFVYGLGVVDTLVCDWECIRRTGINDGGSTNKPTTSRMWAVLHTVGSFMCHAYTYNGVGISYTVAREVLSICEQFNVLQEQYP